MTTTIDGLGTIPSYTGDFPSPIRLMWYVPDDASEVLKVWYPPSEIRGWLRNAAAYHDVPYEIAAAVLQNENNPNAPAWRKWGQLAERTVQTGAAVLDKWAFDLVPDVFADASSGIANMKRRTLRNAASYSESVLHRPVMPNSVRTRLFGYNADSRIQGNDMHADFYYYCAHLRELIDRITGTQGYSGVLTMDQVEKVCAAYNGSGAAAAGYGKKAVENMKLAASGGTPLYFYEK